MARASLYDPIEKFRFNITVITIDLSLTGALETLANFIPNTAVGNAFKKELAVISRAGFSEITLPKANSNEITYRENIDNLRFIKSPGLTKYDPVVLRRGVTDSKDLYNWYRLVNNENSLLSAASELSVSFKNPPRQSEHFRKEVIIDVLDREGNPARRWILFNAWPISYKGGNDLNASIDEKLVEELTLTYEFFTELSIPIIGGKRNAVAGTAIELAEDAAEGAIDQNLLGISDTLKTPF